MPELLEVHWQLYLYVSVTSKAAHALGTVTLWVLQNGGYSHTHFYPISGTLISAVWEEDKTLPCVLAVIREMSQFPSPSPEILVHTVPCSLWLCSHEHACFASEHSEGTTGHLPSQPKLASVHLPVEPGLTTKR